MLECKHNIVETQSKSDDQVSCVPCAWEYKWIKLIETEIGIPGAFVNS